MQPSLTSNMNEGTRRKLPAKLREWFSKLGFLLNLNDEVDDYGAAAFNILQVKGLVG